MSDHVLRISAGPGGALLLTVMLAACSDEGKPASEALPPAPPVEMEALTDAELMGIPRDRLILTLPWSEVPVSRDPAPNSARATLRSVDVSGGERFDRAIFVFGTDAPFPGYRIVWDDSAAAVCGEEDAPDLGPEPVLLIRFEPSIARDDGGRTTVAQLSRRPGLPAVATAAQLCDQNDHLVWALGASDSTRFRIVELRGPPRLLVDVQHQDAEEPSRN